MHSNWPEFYKPTEEATQPAEELLLVKSGGDYGWPECYYDVVQKHLVLAPEYGGDGGKSTGVCGSKTGPVAPFPAHWGPNAITFYDKSQFPARYRDGVSSHFTAHGIERLMRKPATTWFFSRWREIGHLALVKSSRMVLQERKKLRTAPRIVPQVSQLDLTARSLYRMTFEVASIGSHTRAAREKPRAHPARVSQPRLET